MQTYKAIAGQSIYDVCLQTYGSLDYLYKLMQDNGILGIDQPVYSGMSFAWDDSLIVDQQLNAGFSASGQKYSTDTSSLGNVNFVVERGAIDTVPNQPSTPYTPPASSGTYQVTLSTSFTSNADGVTTITPLDINNNTLVGCDIVQIELEIKGLKKSEYSWNKTTGVLTLLGGVTCDNGMTLFILYSKMVTS
ncbi:MAG: hypothetical protein WCH59_09355 [Chitinophagia bacterium]|jgi:hypothetical protein